VHLVVRYRHTVLIAHGAEVGSSAAISSRISTVADASSERNSVESSMANWGAPVATEDGVFDPVARGRDVEPFPVNESRVSARDRSPGPTGSAV
jgi:hypothetical protein